MERSFRQVLKQHYDLQDKHNELHQRMEAMSASQTTTQSGPTTTKILGLPVAPVDTQTLADGALLRFNKKAGNFSFS